MNQESKRDIIYSFELFLFQEGFVNLFFLKMLGAHSFYELGIEIDAMYNELKRSRINVKKKNQV